MKGSVTSADIRPAIAALRTVDAGLVPAWRAQARTEMIDPLVRVLRAAAPNGELGRAAARSVRPSAGQIPGFRYGVGTFKPGFQPAFGLEWGAHRDAYHQYIRRSKRGGHHLVSRRVNLWARPVNRSGWWMTPTFRQAQPELRDKAAAIMDDLLTGRL
jgi:hypothetical protein